MTNMVAHPITIVDRHPWVLHGLSQLIQSQPDLAVSRTFAEWRTLLSDRCNPLPGVILLDWEAPGIGRAALNTIREALPHTKIIAMGVWQSSRSSAMAAGVDGYVNKTDSPSQVLAVLRRVGQIPVPVMPESNRAQSYGVS